MGRIGNVEDDGAPIAMVNMLGREWRAEGAPLRVQQGTEGVPGMPWPPRRASPDPLSHMPQTLIRTPLGDARLKL